MLEVPARKFFVYNAIGGVVWTEGVLIAGHLVGSTVPASKVDTYIIPITLLIVVLSAIPVLKEVLAARKQKRDGTGPVAVADAGAQDQDEYWTPASSGNPGRHKK